MYGLLVAVDFIAHAANQPPSPDLSPALEQGDFLPLPDPPPLPPVGNDISGLPEAPDDVPDIPPLNWRERRE
jgi:hypothetical protein